MAMSRFKKGATYRFTQGVIKAEKFANARIRRLAFVREEPGTGVTHHLFMMTGGSLESFTEWQLADYQIEKVA